MQRLFLLSIFLLATIRYSQAQSAWSDQTRLLPDSLRRLPVGLLMSHTPNPCYPEKITGEDKYVWKHSTSIQTTGCQLEVVSCGSFIWIPGKGWMANMRYDKAQFAQKFNCQDGLIKPGAVYTFPQNYRYSNQVFGGDALWYVIARDYQGKLYKGYSLIETEGEFSSRK